MYLKMNITNIYNKNNCSISGIYVLSYSLLNWQTHALRCPKQFFFQSKHKNTFCVFTNNIDFNFLKVSAVFSIILFSHYINICSVGTPILKYPNNITD